MRNRTRIYSQASTIEKVHNIVEWLSDKKSINIVALDLRQEHSLSEAVVIASATSVRHAQGLADHVLATAKSEGYEYLRMEGYTVGQWILLDFNDVIVHIFQPDSRTLFRLDDMWPSAPILADTREETPA